MIGLWLQNKSSYNIGICYSKKIPAISAYLWCLLLLLVLLGTAWLLRKLLLLFLALCCCWYLRLRVEPGRAAAELEYLLLLLLVDALCW